MKTIIYSIAVGAMFLLLSSCGGVKANANDHAEEMCECLQDAGLDNTVSIMKLQDRSYTRDLERNMEKTVPRCMLPILKEIEEEINDLSKNDKKEYTKAFLKACIDTECADLALDMIPYDMLGIALGEAERQIERREEYMQEREEREVEREVERDFEKLDDLFN